MSWWCVIVHSAIALGTAACFAIFVRVCVRTFFSSAKQRSSMGATVKATEYLYSDILRH